MSSSLSYHSDAPLVADLRASILTHISDAIAGYEWWCEPLRLTEEAGRPECLAGTTKLMVALEDMVSDSFMAYVDATKILQVLSSASLEFGVTWELSAEGSPVGKIVAGTPDAETNNSVGGLLEICTMMGANPLELDRDAILAANKDRLAATV